MKKLNEKELMEQMEKEGFRVGQRIDADFLKKLMNEGK